MAHLSHNKSGIIHNLLWVLLWITILAIVVGSLFSFVRRVESDQKFERIKTVNDFALTAGATTIPGYDYEMGLLANPYNIEFDKGVAKATNTEKIGLEITKLTEAATYPADSKQPILAGQSTQNQKLTLEKDGHRISLNTDKQEKLFEKSVPNALNCPTMPSIKDLEITIDPAHGGKNGAIETGEVAYSDSGTITESDITTQLANELSAQLHANSKQSTSTRLDNTNLDTKTRLERIKENTILVSLHAHDSTTGSTSVSATITNGENSESNLALACNILNAILNIKTETQFDGANIIQTDPKYLPEDVSKVISKPKIGIVLTFNTLDLQKKYNPVLQNPSLISAAIASTLKEATQ